MPKIIQVDLLLADLALQLGARAASSFASAVSGGAGALAALIAKPTASALRPTATARRFGTGGQEPVPPDA